MYIFYVTGKGNVFVNKDSGFVLFLYSLIGDIHHLPYLLAFLYNPHPLLLLRKKGNDTPPPCVCLILCTFLHNTHGHGHTHTDISDHTHITHSNTINKHVQVGRSQPATASYSHQLQLYLWRDISKKKDQVSSK
jgi:hypothetical protein